MSDSNDKKWFEKLRVNSWEIEILIVACILAGLFTIPDIPADKLAALEVSNHNDFRAYKEGTDTIWAIIGFFKMFMYLGIQSFLDLAKLTFSLYILFRGFWVAVIGLSSVFPNGINTQRLNFSSYFNKMLPKDSFDNYIIRLDNICSSIFSLGFLTGLYTVSVMFYISFSLFCISSLEYIILQLYGSPPDYFYTILMIILALVGIIFFMDIILLGIFKKVKWKVFSFPYSKIHKILMLVSFFFLYESVYYLFVSNVKRRVVVLFWLLFFVFIAFTFISRKADGYLLFPEDTELRFKSFMSKSYYEDRLLAASDNFSSTPRPFINSEIISESYLKLHIPFHPIIHSSIDSACGLTSPNGTWKIKRYGSWYFDNIINCINSKYGIYIDNDTLLNDFNFYNYSAIVDDKDVSIKTFFMPISVSSYEEGRHVLTIEKLFYQEYVDVEPDSVAIVRGDSLGISINIKEVLVKAADSLIHIPFYIYR